MEPPIPKSREPFPLNERIQQPIRVRHHEAIWLKKSQPIRRHGKKWKTKKIKMKEKRFVPTVSRKGIESMSVHK